jgi:hypothetical protein
MGPEIGPEAGPKMGPEMGPMGIGDPYAGTIGAPLVYLTSAT